MAISRKYELYIGGSSSERAKQRDNYKYQEQDTGKTGAKSASPPSEGDIPISNKFVLITDLQMQAEGSYIKKGDGKKSQSSKVTVYNPNEETKQYLKRGNIVILKAGYESDESLDTIMTGQIHTVSETRDKTDIKVVISCSEVFIVKQGLRFSKAYSKGTKYTQIFNDIIRAYANNGIPLGFFDVSQLDNKVTKKGFSFSGNVSNTLSELCEALNYHWYTSLSKLFIVPKTKQTYVRTIVVQDGDVKGSIEPQDDATGKDKAQSKEALTGLRMKLALVPKASTATHVRVNRTNTKFNGDYLINKIDYRLDYEGNEWDLNIECEG